MTQFTFRKPVPGDQEAVEATAAEGIAGYAAFAPSGWTPPEPHSSSAPFADPTRWWLLAEVEGRPAGHVVFLPAAVHPKPVADPRLAHLGGLFVRVAFHGSGLASTLLGRARVEARGRGFSAGRLFCAADYARARRFYEREGWRVAGEPFPEPHYGGLALVEYRLACPA